MKFCSIALIGFRATGKSSVGALLARKLHREFLDMDEEITRHLGMSIQEWVELHGWPSFRDAESRLLQELSRKKNLVLATGGGVIEKEGNRELLRKNFMVVWLQASASTLLQRLEKDPVTKSNRPPLTDLAWKNEVEEVIRRRDPLYSQCAHIHLDTGALTREETAHRLLETLKRSEKCPRE